MAWRSLLGSFVWAIASLACVAAQEAPSKSSSVLIAVGAPGTDEYHSIFAASADRWKSALADRAITMVGSEADSQRETILKWIEAIGKERAEPSSGQDLAMLILIGHGTSDASGAKFNLVGPDLSAEDLKQALSKAPGPWLIINASSSSGPFINALSGADRIVITATKSGSEQNYSRFAEYLSKAVHDPGADLDHDEAISVLEAFLAASHRVAQFYSDEKRLASEQALLDDNGDQRGTPASFYRGVRPQKAPEKGLKLDGSAAHRFTLRSFAEKSEDREVNREAIGQLEEKIEALRQQKAVLDEEDYYLRLEELLVALATQSGL